MTDKRQNTAIFIEICQSLENFLQERMCIDDKITSVLSAFVSLSKEADIQEVFNIFGKDLNLSDLDNEYSEIIDFKSIDVLRKQSLSEKINYLASCKNYKINFSIL